VGFAPDPQHPLDESHYFDAPRAVSIRSKVLAERLARAGSAHDTEVVIVNLSGVFGPHDHRLTPAMRALRGLVQGDPAYLHFCVTDVRDVATAQILAAKKGRVGARYLVTGDNLSPAEQVALLQDLAGAGPPRFRPPELLLKLLAHRAEARALRDQSDTPFDVQALDDMAGGHPVYDSRRARKELGARFRPAREVFTDALRWLLHVEALRPRVAERVRAALGPRGAPDPDWVPGRIRQAA
jgi:dihydroflavonol-4-reductase